MDKLPIISATSGSLPIHDLHYEYRYIILSYYAPPLENERVSCLDIANEGLVIKQNILKTEIVKEHTRIQVIKKIYISD